MERLNVLHSLYMQRENSSPRGVQELGWCRAMDVGGRDASSHSAWLRQLVKRGLVEMRPRHTYKEGRLYRITDAGIETLRLEGLALPSELTP